MIVTVFRTRLRPEAAESYADLVPRVVAVAVAMPGYVSHKLFVAEDGERVMVVEFETEEALAAWARHPDHVPAKRLGRKEFYSEYSYQVCRVLRQGGFGPA